MGHQSQEWYIIQQDCEYPLHTCFKKAKQSRWFNMKRAAVSTIPLKYSFFSLIFLSLSNLPFFLQRAKYYQGKKVFTLQTEIYIVKSTLWQWLTVPVVHCDTICASVQLFKFNWKQKQAWLYNITIHLVSNVPLEAIIFSHFACNPLHDDVKGYIQKRSPLL